MFGAEYLLAFIKVCLNVALAIVTAFPFKFAWNCTAGNYLANYIPEQFVHLPYWHTVGFLLVAMFLGEMIQQLTPKFVTVSQSNENK